MVLQAEEIQSGSFKNIDDVIQPVEGEHSTPDSLYVLKRYINEWK